MINQELVKLGEYIHDALLHFARYSGSDIYFPSLEGGCAVASAFLIKEAKFRLNLDLGFAATECHAWTEYNGMIYDLTAKQFAPFGRFDQEPKVKLIPLDVVNGNSRYFEPETRKISFINREWPKGQRPMDYKLIWKSPTKAIVRSRNVEIIT